ncbi:unnamed protein product [Arctogadus glacialis]
MVNCRYKLRLHHRGKCLLTPVARGLKFITIQHPHPHQPLLGRRPMSQETNELIVPLRLPAPGFQSDQQLSVGDVLDHVHQSKADCQETKQTAANQPELQTTE